MHVLGHLVGRSGLIQRFDHLLPSQRNVHVHYPSGFIQAIHVILDKGPLAIIEADAFPDAISQHKARIINRNQRLFPWDNLTVQVDLERLIPFIRFGFVGRTMFWCGAHWELLGEGS